MIEHKIVYNQNRSIRVDCRGRGRRYYQQWGAAHQGSVDHTHSYHCTQHSHLYIWYYII